MEASCQADWPLSLAGSAQLVPGRDIAVVDTLLLTSQQILAAADLRASVLARCLAAVSSEGLLV